MKLSLMLCDAAAYTGKRREGRSVKGLEASREAYSRRGLEETARWGTESMLVLIGG
jgi:hypothetical protein